MPYFDGWFGDDYAPDDWFDPDEGTVTPPSSGVPVGSTKPRLLGTLNTKPVVPVWRQIDGPTGIALTEIRKFLSEVVDKDHNWGNLVQVEFTAAITPTRVATGLGGPCRGYRIEKANADVRVFDATPPTPVPERGVIWLQASAPAKVTLYVY